MVYNTVAQEVLLILPFVLTNIRSEMWLSGDGDNFMSQMTKPTVT